MKKIIILLLTAASFVLFAQEQEDTAESVNEKEYTAIDESTLTFETAPQTAGQESEFSETIPTTGGIKTSDYLRIIFFLIVVIVIVWLFIRLLKRYSGNHFGDQDMINIMGSQVLSADTSLHVVEIENSYYLLGSSSTNVAMITEISDQETIDALKLKRSAQAQGGNKSFFEMLTGLTSSKKQPGEDASATSVNFLQKQRDRLKDL